MQIPSCLATTLRMWISWSERRIVQLHSVSSPVAVEWVVQFGVAVWHALTTATTKMSNSSFNIFAYPVFILDGPRSDL
jgi:hypothetical protein